MCENLLCSCCVPNNNEISEKEMKKTIPFAIATKGMKYLRINLTKK